MGLIVLTQLATGLSVLAGAVLVKSVMEQKPMMGPGRMPRCPSCNGTGRVTCSYRSDLRTGLRETNPWTKPNA
ncbi:Heat shock, cysteine-rich domain containing [Olea europaea subsp. europaea]|uniref:Heat shock, cysteine-rich domain containing n=1 Tax=Olea europaea subsp. europaea TaxID=158383 RepID=A0A8S0QVL6_OLEEU|nr:Heat shock, cysteine-rich domain containing [Olea europaea subsp. europaea]